MDDFSLWTVPRLKSYLKEFQVQYSGHRRDVLIRLCECVYDVGLDVDPDMTKLSAEESLKRKLDSLGIVDPLCMDDSDFSNDLSSVELVSLYGIFNHLICSVADYDHKKLKAYKSFDDYRLYVDGHVEDLKVKQTENYNIFKALVKPTQREKTYINQPFYKLWVVCEPSGSVVSCFCQCQGGSDGGCRHISAVLYDMESYNDRVKSVTDGPMRWAKRARQSDEAAPAESLVIKKARFRDVLQPIVIPEIDVRQPADRVPHSNEKIQAFVNKLHTNNLKCTALELLEEVDDDADAEIEEEVQKDVPLNVPQRMEAYLKQDGGLDLEVFWRSFCFSNAEVNEIQSLTRGQSETELWGFLRLGLVTASNAKRVCTRSVTLEKHEDADPANLLRDLIEKRAGGAVSGHCAYGRQNETPALKKYSAVNRKVHSNFELDCPGLIVSQKFPLTGCSPDGVGSCSCNDHSNEWLIEVKCPSTARFLEPREAMKKTCGGVENPVTGEMEMRRDHPYFYQVQFSMGLLGLHECDFVVYTKRGLFTLRVLFDEAFFVSKMDVIQGFIKNFMFPSLYARNQ